MTQEERRKIYGIMKCPFIVDEVTQEEPGRVLSVSNDGTLEWTSPTPRRIPEIDLDDMWSVDTGPPSPPWERPVTVEEVYYNQYGNTRDDNI